jgi:hypothetical protein
LLETCLQFNFTIPLAAHPVGPEADPIMGAINDSGGPEAAAPGRRSFQTINGEGLFQAPHQLAAAPGNGSPAGLPASWAWPCPLAMADYTSFLFKCYGWIAGLMDSTIFNIFHRKLKTV